MLRVLCISSIKAENLNSADQHKSSESRDISMTERYSYKFSGTDKRK